MLAVQINVIIRLWDHLLDLAFVPNNPFPSSFLTNLWHRCKTSFLGCKGDSKEDAWGMRRWKWSGMQREILRGCEGGSHPPSQPPLHLPSQPLHPPSNPLRIFWQCEVSLLSKAQIFISKPMTREKIWIKIHVVSDTWYNENLQSCFNFLSQDAIEPAKKWVHFDITETK